MNNREFTAKWGEFTSDAVLTEDDTLAMEQLVESDAVLRAEIAEDHQLHRMLRSLATIHDSQEDFVGDVMAACQGVDNPVAQLLPKSDAPQRALSWPWKLSAGWLLLAIPCVLLGGAYLVLRSQVDIAYSRAEMAMLAAKRAEQKAVRADDAAKESAAVAERAAKQQAVARKPLVHLPVAADTPKVQEPVPVLPTGTVATITGRNHCVWAVAPKSKDLVAGEYELLNGEVILRTTGGSAINILAPAKFDLHHSAGMTLNSGNIEVQVASSDVGFRVTTANSRIIDLGTRFSVSLNGDDQTRVRLDTGEVVVMPRQQGSKPTRHYLRVGEYDEAIVRGTVKANSLQGTHRSGPAGFIGTVGLAGDTHEFGSRDRFEHVYKAVAKQIADHPQETREAWSELRKVIDRVSITATLGDGEEETFDGLDGVLRLEEVLADPPPLRNSLQRLNAKDLRVRGSLVVAGRRYPFRSLSQYEQVRSRALRVLSQLGVQSMMQTREAHDRSTNPFESLDKPGLPERRR